MRIFILIAFLIFSVSGFEALSLPGDQAQTLTQLLIQFKKNPTNAHAKEELAQFYNQRKKIHEQTLLHLSRETDLGHWDKLIAELNEMQEEFKLISASEEAVELLNPVDYSYSLNNTKELAAASCYQRGIDLSKRTDSKSYSFRLAALAFRKANEFVPGYRDASLLANQASKKVSVNVLITGIQFDSGYYKGGVYYGSDARFQDVLATKLNQVVENGSARFFTQEQALEENETMDWVIYLNWSDVGSHPTSAYQATGTSQKDVQVGTDKSGNPIVRTKYADVSSFERTVSTSGNLFFSIRDVRQGEEIAAGSIHTESQFTESSVEFAGDAGGLNDRSRQNIDFNKSTSGVKSDTDEGMTSMNKRIFDPLKYKILNAIAF